MNVWPYGVCVYVCVCLRINDFHILNIFKRSLPGTTQINLRVVQRSTDLRINGKCELFSRSQLDQICLVHSKMLISFTFRDEQPTKSMESGWRDARIGAPIADL